MNQVTPFVLSRLLSSLRVSRTGSDSDWCALQEALYSISVNPGELGSRPPDFDLGVAGGS